MTSSQKRITLTILGVLLTSYYTQAAAEHRQCTSPNITGANEVFWTPYQIRTLVDVPIFYCYRIEAHKIYECFSNSRTTNLSHAFNYISTDASESCLRAFKTNTYFDRIDKRTVEIEEINKDINVTSTNTGCEHNRLHESTVFIRIEKFSTTADVISDQVILKSNTVCKFSNGFCYDNKTYESAIWEPNYNKSNERHLLSSISINRRDLYFLELKKRYLVFENEYETFALQILDKLEHGNVKVWSTSQTGVVLSSKGAEYNSNEAEKFPQYSPRFISKKELFESVVEACRNDFQTMNLSKKVKVIETSLSDIKNYVIGRDMEIEGMMRKLDYISYVMVIVGIYIILHLGSILYKKWKKEHPQQKILGYEHSKVDVAPNLEEQKANPNVYEYITSEYNVNELYNKK